MDFAEIFRYYKVPFVEVGPWRAHVRPGTFKPEGILLHHTASRNYEATLQVVRHGRDDLAGPLCNIYIARGKAHIISAGRANHAGLGAKEALEHIRAGLPPAGSARDQGYLDDEDTGGNGLLVGFEILSPGTGPRLPDEDWDVTARASTAILKALGKRDIDRVIGHAHWTRRKIDPVLGRPLPGKPNTAHENLRAFRKYCLDRDYI